jgi:hypothetical protein
MKTSISLLALWLVTVPLALRANEPPVVFARSGQKVTLPVHVEGDQAERQIVISAFGQQWGESITVKDNGVTFLAPKVRVPVVFRVNLANDVHTLLGEVIVYTDRMVLWDKDTQLASVTNPDWFNTWSKAVGLPIRQFAKIESLEAEHWPDSEKPSLLILGHKSSQGSLGDLCRLATEKEINILLLETDWSEQRDRGSRTTSIAPAQIQGNLAIIGWQSWPQPLEFSARRWPCPCIVNRWAWIIDTEGIPLVEQLAVYDEPMTVGRSVVVSYTPWQQQLGRNADADATLLALLSAAAKTSLPTKWRRIEIVCPKRDVLSDRNRPILTAAVKATAFADVSSDNPLHVFDLRDPLQSTQEAIDEEISLEEQIEAIEKRSGIKDDKLLILGDDKLLDEWKWLKLDRAKKTIGRPGVVWLSDDDLPPSYKSRIQLMLILTKLGVPLSQPRQ